MKKKILIIGQTPPPYHGQAIMIENLLKGDYQDIQLYHSRMSFSREMDEVGRLNLFKIVHLFQMIVDILIKKFSHGISILYFPPTGPKKVAFYRDAIILICVRPFFKKVIFHFHAAGISELYPNLNFFEKTLFRKAYYNADIGIRLSKHSVDDSSKLNIRTEFIVPYGVNDNSIDKKNIINVSGCTILFVGLLNRTKGITILIEACSLLKKRGLEFKVQVMGKFESSKFELEVRELVLNLGLEQNISFLGVMVGKDKFEAFSSADIFCFPTYYESESFPVVILEALSFGLPIVSTQWRGIPTMVADGENGFLTEIQNPEATANSLNQLISDHELRTAMGMNSRIRYMNEFSIERYHKNLEAIFNYVQP